MSERIFHPLPPVTVAERAAYGVVADLRAAGYIAYTVGGAVRDRLLGRPCKDVDVTTDATPEQVIRLFPRTVAVGAAFGVVVVVLPETQIEVATFRIDLDYEDGRRPTSVQFATAEEDARRRDFTVNALYYDPVEQVIVDFVGGLADLRAGRLRAIGDARERFGEDYLRMLRAVRFTAQLGFELDAATLDAVRLTAERIVRISPERICAELTKMLVGRAPRRAFELLDESGLLVHVLPEIAAMHGVLQPPQYHPEGDVFVHTMCLLGGLVTPEPELAWSVLLHDVGKPPTFAINQHGRESFPCHANVGSVMARDILQRLKCANALIDQVVEAVYYHMTFGDVHKMKEATLRRFMARPTFKMELELHRIDCMACHRNLENYAFLLDRLHARQNEPALPVPYLNGADLKAAGLTPGPRFGELLRDALDRQLEGEFADRDEALAWLAGRIAADAAAPAPLVGGATTSESE